MSGLFYHRHIIAVWKFWIWCWIPQFLLVETTMDELGVPSSIRRWIPPRRASDFCWATLGCGSEPFHTGSLALSSRVSKHPLVISRSYGIIWYRWHIYRLHMMFQLFNHGDLPVRCAAQSPLETSNWPCQCWSLEDEFPLQSHDSAGLCWFAFLHQKYHSLCKKYDLIWFTLISTIEMGLATESRSGHLMSLVNAQIDGNSPAISWGLIGHFPNSTLG